MEPAGRERRPLDVEAQLRGALSAQVGGPHGACGDEDAGVVPKLPAETRRVDLTGCGEIDGDRERLAGEKLLPLVACRIQEPHAFDPRDVASPLLQAGGALL